MGGPSLFHDRLGSHENLCRRGIPQTIRTGPGISGRGGAGTHGGKCTHSARKAGVEVAFSGRRFPGGFLSGQTGTKSFNAERSRFEKESGTQHPTRCDQSDSSKQTIELAGLHADVRSHTLNPVIYVSIDRSDPLQGYTADTAKDHLHIVRCEIKNQNRIVGAVKIAIYGKATQSAQFVETTVEPISDYWVKVSPVSPLERGEYALVEFDENGAMNQFVWDFGVDPEAEPNLKVIRPSVDKNEPVLIKTREKAKQ